MIFPYFQLGCNFEVNVERTKAYLASADCGDDMRSSIRLTCDCQPLHYVFNDNDVPVPATYTDPATDDAPWYDANIPESLGFLGFMIENVNVNAISARKTTTRMSSSGGGVLGPLRSKERRLDFTVLMFACNELSMEYGFRYLTDALGTPGCDDECTLCDAEFRDSCPEVDGTIPSLNKGRWILKNVGLVDGPVWGDNPLKGSACNIRRVTFSLVSELPWKFKCPVVECQDIALAGYPSDGVDCVNWDEILCGQQEVSCAVSENLVIGETGMIIEITAGSVPLQHIDISIRPDPYGYECDETSRPPGYVRSDPCDRIVVPWIPASSTLVYDTSIEQVKIVLPGGGEIDGTAYISTDEGSAPTFPTLRCGTFCVSVAVSECSVVGSSTVTIKSVHREI
jgi:hypothetical protein